MKFKLLVKLFFAVSIVAFLTWVSLRVTDSTYEKEMQLKYLFPSFQEDISKITIDYGTNQISLSANIGDEWKIEKPFSAIADNSKLAKMMDVLAGLKREEIISGEQREARGLSLRDYGLEKPQITIIIGDRKNKITLLIGRKSPVGELVYTRIEGESDVVATSAEILNILPRRAEEIQDYSIARGSVEATTRLEIQSKRYGFIQAAKSGDEWQIQQPIACKADTSKINKMLSTLYESKIVRFYLPQTIEKGNNYSEDTSKISSFTPINLMADNADLRVSIWNSGWIAGKDILFAVPLEESSELVYTKISDTEPLCLVNKRVRDIFLLPLDELRDFHIFNGSPNHVRYMQFKKGDSEIIFVKELTEGWFIRKPFVWRADNFLVDDTIKKIMGIKALPFDANTKTNEWISSLFTKPSFEILLSFKAWKSGTDGKILKVAMKPQSDGYLAKFEGENLFYEIAADEISFLLTKLTDPLVYRDKTVMSIVPEKVIRICLNKQGKEQIVKRNKRGEWECVAGGTIVETNVLDELLLTIANLKTIRFEAFAYGKMETYGLDNPYGTLVLNMDETSSIQKSLLLGYKAGVDGLFGMVKGDDTVFVIDNDTVKSLMRNICR